MTKPLYFYNGSTFELVGPTVPQSPIAYQTSAPTAPATGDLWIDSDGDVDTYNRQLTRFYFVATAGQTSISGIDANGLTLAYTPGSETVYVNGALQVRGVDYIATNGTSITGLSALALNDVVEVFAYTAFVVANTYTKSEVDGIAAAAAGKVVQIVGATKTSSFSSSALDTEQFVYELSITPTSAANKILLFVNTNGIDNGGSGRLNTRIRYNTTSGGITGTILLDQMTIGNDSAGTNGMSGASGTVLTSAIGSTSTQYFKLTATKYDSSTTWYVCRYDTTSTLVAMEVKP